MSHCFNQFAILQGPNIAQWAGTLVHDPLQRDLCPEAMQGSGEKIWNVRSVVHRPPSCLRCVDFRFLGS